MNPWKDFQSELRKIFDGLFWSLENVDAKSHAARWDERLGIQTQNTEDKLSQKPEYRKTQEKEFWVGLPVESLLTPYIEWVQICQELQPAPGQVMVDLGMAYGRLGLVLGALYPEVYFIGYEAVSERTEEARRLFHLYGCVKAQAITQDLTDPQFVLPFADIYFLYDYGSRQAIEKTLDDLRLHAQTHCLCVIARGGRSRSLIEKGCPWLSQVQKPRHFPNFSIYRSE